MLARMARMDPRLLCPIRHRGKQAQADLGLLRSRDAAVATRTKLINHVRGAVKSFGLRLPGSSAPYFHAKVKSAIPEELQPALLPLLKMIGQLTDTIKNYEERIEKLGKERYPETELLRTVPGVGPITALCFVLTLEDPHRFKNSRAVSAYFGLTPARGQSGKADPELRITKSGDKAMRRLLVSCAQYILRKSSPDSELRRWGLKLAEGGSRAKRRAVVAVARKLAAILHRLWTDGSCYEPFFNHQDETTAAA
jgi:transposase